MNPTQRKERAATVKQCQKHARKARSAQARVNDAMTLLQPMELLRLAFRFLQKSSQGHEVVSPLYQHHITPDLGTFESPCTAPGGGCTACEALLAGAALRPTRLP